MNCKKCNKPFERGIYGNRQYCYKCRPSIYIKPDPQLRSYWYGEGSSEYAVAFLRTLGIDGRNVSSNIAAINMVNEFGKPLHTVVKVKDKYLDAMMTYGSKEKMVAIWQKIYNTKLTLVPFKEKEIKANGISFDRRRILAAKIFILSNEANRLSIIQKERQ